MKLQTSLEASMFSSEVYVESPTTTRSLEPPLKQA